MNGFLSRRSFLRAGAASAAALGLYAASHARHELDITRHTVRVANLPAPFEGFRIAQLSDIHYDEYTEPWFAHEVVRRTNELQADLVVLTGDFISRGPLSHAFARGKAEECADVLAALTCPQRFSILGNHDASVDADYVAATLRERTLPVLDDSFVPIERHGARLWLCGARDPGVLQCDPNRAIPERPDGPVIFLVHEPDFAIKLAGHARFPLVDLMLSGHSHGGQVRLPLLGPLVLPPLGQRYVAGFYRLDHMQLYVNRGIGTVGMPFRLNCPPEITEFTLRRA